MIKIEEFNETYVRVISNEWGEEQHISESFTFFVPGYRYIPSFRNGMWDGKIRLYDLRKKTIYKGLLSDLIKFLKTNDYEFQIDASLKNQTEISTEAVKKYIDDLELYARGDKLEIREYQYEAVDYALQHKRSLLLSPTASGKSMIIMSYIRWHIAKGRNVLIVVPTTMLVEQLYADFKDYSSKNGWNVEDNIGVLYSGKERVFEKPVVISTWQSIASMMKSDQKNFNILVERSDVAVWDEAHTYKANVVLSVMEKFVNTEYRLGTTGTIDDSKINGLTLVGLMGPIYKVTTTKQLMDDGHVVKLDINVIQLQYPDHLKKAYKRMTYVEEINFLVGYAPRNDFIAKLCTKIPGNVLVLFNFVDRHGAVLEELIRSKTDRPVFFIHGGVDTKAREEIRKLLDDHTNAIVVATASLMSTGVNIPSLDNVLFAIPSKATIRIRQSIGRSLRLKEGKAKAVLWDIADNLSWGKWENTTLRHLDARLTIYTKEQFDFTIKKLKIGE
jgi:superfamily II DNA or RNA helicase